MPRCHEHIQTCDLRREGGASEERRVCYGGCRVVKRQRGAGDLFAHPISDLACVARVCELQRSRALLDMYVVCDIQIWGDTHFA